MDGQRNQSLPERLRALFWDVRFEDLNWESHRSFIVGRILERGAWQDIQWLRQTVGDEALCNYILDHKGKGLSPRQLRYWQLIFDLPDELVDEWIMQFRQSVWGRRVPR